MLSDFRGLCAYGAENARDGDSGPEVIVSLSEHLLPDSTYWGHVGFPLLFLVADDRFHGNEVCDTIPLRMLRAPPAIRYLTVPWLLICFLVQVVYAVSRSVLQRLGESKTTSHSNDQGLALGRTPAFRSGLTPDIGNIIVGQSATQSNFVVSCRGSVTYDLGARG